MSNHEATVIPTRMCIVRDGRGVLRFRFNKEPILHDNDEEAVMQMMLDFSRPDHIVENAFRVAFGVITKVERCGDDEVAVRGTCLFRFADNGVVPGHRPKRDIIFVAQGVENEIN